MRMFRVWYSKDTQLFGFICIEVKMTLEIDVWVTIFKI